MCLTLDAVRQIPWSRRRVVENGANSNDKYRNAESQRIYLEAFTGKWYNIDKYKASVMHSVLKFKGGKNTADMRERRI